MNEQRHQFLTLRHLPARLTGEEVAWLLNCQPHDLRAVLAAKLLRPLGNPPPNGIKFFATGDLLEQMKDRAWLARVTNAISQHWQRKNARKKERPSEGSPEGQPSLLAV